MPDTLVWTALAMGLAGGPHCLAMCAAPCGALVRAGGPAHAAAENAGAQTVRWAGRGLALPADRVWARPFAFHLGRLAGYALAGAMAAWAMDRLAWLTQHAAALRPAWTLLHVAVLAWAVLLVFRARQPAWVDHAGRVLWQRVAPWVRSPGGLFSTGLAWACMPCGLLYSALLLAALTGNPWRGALAMVCFGVGGAAWLVAGQWLWQRLRGGGAAGDARGGWGVRLSGLLLFGIAAWGLWMDVFHRQAEPWCL